MDATAKNKILSMAIKVKGFLRRNPARLRKLNMNVQELDKIRTEYSMAVGKRPPKDEFCQVLKKCGIRHNHKDATGAVSKPYH